MSLIRSSHQLPVLLRRCSGLVLRRVLQQQAREKSAGQQNMCDCSSFLEAIVVGQCTQRIYFNAGRVYVYQRQLSGMIKQDG